jgi:hypothetical protein
MSKSFKAAAVLLCLAFVLVTVPTLNSAEKRPLRLSLALFLNQPVQTLTAAFPFMNMFFGKEGRLAPAISGKSIVKPTDTIQIGKPGTGD